MNDLAHQLRALNEDDVLNALDGACVSLPIQTAAEAVELINCVLDMLGVPDQDGEIPTLE